MNKKYIIITAVVALVVISSIVIVANISRNKDNEDETLISEATTEEISGDTTDASSTEITTASTNETTTKSNTTTGTTKNSTSNTTKSSTNQTTSNTTITKNQTTQETFTNSPLTTPTATGSSYAQQVIDLVNAQRAQSGLAPVSTNNSISTEALVRAQEIESTFSHTRPDGSSFYTALTQYAVPYSGAGENIAYGQSTPEQVMQSWMNSSGHRANILNANYTTIGVGCYQNAAGVFYWVQSFVY